MLDEIAHYTTEQGLVAILNSKKLWATHYRFLNDLSETQHGIDIINNIYHKVLKSMPEEDNLRRFIEQEGPKILQDLWSKGISPNGNDPELFMTSFSIMPDENKDDGILSQWRSYGDIAGFAIVFSRDDLTKSYDLFSKKCKEHIGPNLQDGCLDCEKFILARIFEPIEYQKDMTELEKGRYKEALGTIKRYAPIFMNSITVGTLNINLEQFDTFVKAIIALLTTIKHPGFHEEKEYRFACLNRIERLGGGYHSESPYEVVMRNNAPRLEIDFLPETIKRIVIGPQPNQDQKAVMVRYYLELYGYKNVDVVKSTIPYRKNISV